MCHGLGIRDIEKKDVIACVAQGGCFGDVAEALLDQNECNGITNKLTLCLFAKNLEVKEIVSDGVLDYVDSIKYDGFDLEDKTKIKLGNKDIGCDGLVYSQCLVEIQNSCGNDLSCVFEPSTTEGVRLPERASF